MVLRSSNRRRKSILLNNSGGILAALDSATLLSVAAVENGTNVHPPPSPSGNIVGVLSPSLESSLSSHDGTDNSSSTSVRVNAESSEEENENESGNEEDEESEEDENDIDCESVVSVPNRNQSIHWTDDDIHSDSDEELEDDESTSDFDPSEVDDDDEDSELEADMGVDEIRAARCQFKTPLKEHFNNKESESPEDKTGSNKINQTIDWDEGTNSVCYDCDSEDVQRSPQKKSSDTGYDESRVSRCQVKTPMRENFIDNESERYEDGISSNKVTQNNDCNERDDCICDDCDDDVHYSAQQKLSTQSLSNPSSSCNYGEKKIQEKLKANISSPGEQSNADKVCTIMSARKLCDVSFSSKSNEAMKTDRNDQGQPDFLSCETKKAPVQESNMEALVIARVIDNDDSESEEYEEVVAEVVESDDESTQRDYSCSFMRGDHQAADDLSSLADQSQSFSQQEFYSPSNENAFPRDQMGMSTQSNSPLVNGFIAKGLVTQKDEPIFELQSVSTLSSGHQYKSAIRHQMVDKQKFVNNENIDKNSNPALLASIEKNIIQQATSSLNQEEVADVLFCSIKSIGRCDLSSIPKAITDNCDTEAQRYVLDTNRCPCEATSTSDNIHIHANDLRNQNAYRNEAEAEKSSHMKTTKLSATQDNLKNSRNCSVNPIVKKVDAEVGPELSETTFASVPINAMSAALSLMSLSKSSENSEGIPSNTDVLNKEKTKNECSGKTVHFAVQTISQEVDGMKNLDKENCNRSKQINTMHYRCDDKTRREGSVKSGKWKLGSKIGAGAFGVVHIGMNMETGKLMAVKSLRIKESIKSDAKREVQLLRALKHENIVQYYGAEMNQKYLHIFQEWVPGGSVTSLLAKFGPFPVSVLRSYLQQILLGLAYLHDNNVIHRDIKGSNILVSDEGIVKLGDFGASKVLSPSQKDMMLSMTMRGTPYFMAPEVFEEKYSSKADIWSVGCVAVQMATGTPPWRELGFSNPVSLFQHISKSGGAPTIRMKDIEAVSCFADERLKLELFRKVIEKCFRRDPSERPIALELLRDGFFSLDHSFTNDEAEISGIFSPLSITSRSLVAAISATGVSVSPVRPPQRRNSFGTVQSPFLSPPIAKSTIKEASRSPLTPQPDSSDWPTWARQKSMSAATHALYSHNNTDSLAYSSDESSLRPHASATKLVHTNLNISSGRISSPDSLLVGVELLDSTSVSSLSKKAIDTK